MKDIGVRPGQVVLDFGCGRGLYSLVAAKVVGSAGSVFALDRNSRLLGQLRQEALRMGLSNIVPVASVADLQAALRGKLLDVVLLYDVIHHYYFTERQRRSLLCSLAAMIANRGLVSIFPKHMEPMAIRQLHGDMKRLGLPLENRRSSELIHDGGYDRGFVLNFRAPNRV